MAQPPMESRPEYLRLGSGPSLRPAQQALLPYLRLHGIDVGIGKDHTAGGATSLHASEIQWTPMSSGAVQGRPDEE
jgi:hypothetical protein